MCVCCVFAVARCTLLAFVSARSMRRAIRRVPSVRRRRWDTPSDCSQPRGTIACGPSSQSQEARSRTAGRHARGVLLTHQQEKWHSQLTSACIHVCVSVCSSQGKPIGVVSITDVLRFASSDANNNSSSLNATPSASASGSQSAVSSTPTTPRKSGVSPSVGSVSPPVARTHLRTHSQTQTPVIVPAPPSV